MNLSAAKICGSLKNAKYAFGTRAHILLSGNANMQTRCKSVITKPKNIIFNKYKKQEESIGLYGYSLLAVPIVTFVLGTWQIKRWRWKLNLIDTLQQRTSMEPTELPLDLNELMDKEYYRVKVKGKFIYENEFLMGPKSLILDGQGVSEKGGAVFSKSNTGYYVITPFKLEDRDLTIMVNRGWISKNAKSIFKQKNNISDSMEIVGIVRTNEKRPPFIAANAPNSGVWHYRDLNQMAKVAKAEPVYIELTTGYGKPGDPIGGQTKVTLRNEHISYVITWYGLSVSTAYIWFRHFVQKLPVM